MNNKRLRQISLFESFYPSKKTSVLNKMEKEKSSDHVAHYSEVSGRLSCNVLSPKRQDADENASDSSSLDCISESNCVSKSNSQDLINNSEELFSGTCDIEEIPDSLESDEKEPSASFSYSQDLFPSYDEELQKIDTATSTASNSQDLLCLNRIPACSSTLPTLTPSEKHIIMFSPHIRAHTAPRPYPSEYRDAWDGDHVRMPCSPLNRFPIDNKIISRWELICQSFSRDIKSSHDLEYAIMKFNSQYVGKWNFEGLHVFFSKFMTQSQHEHFFEVVMPAMVKMALQLPKICTRPPPLLKKHRDRFLTLSQKQIGCFLANAFFCTFPRRNRTSRLKNAYSEYATYPDINFHQLFAGKRNNIASRQAEKLKCLINYFTRITSKEPCGTVTFHRQHVQHFPQWKESMNKIRKVIITSDGLIEKDGYGMLQVDFANSFVGGGVLGRGCVQEEIRFIICPELIVSRLFVESLDASEALVITGVEQYNCYSGYADTFKWEGNFEDQTPRDAWGRRCTQVVAMDAVHFSKSDDQFKHSSVKRELNKAYCGFYEDELPPNLPAIATGNWGCGIFNGNPELKFLIQLMAASEAGRGILYFTFGNNKLKSNLEAMYQFLHEKDATVGDVWKVLSDYNESMMVYAKDYRPDLYDYIYFAYSEPEMSSEEQIANVSPDSSQPEDTIQVTNDPG